MFLDLFNGYPRLGRLDDARQHVHGRLLPRCLFSTLPACRPTPFEPSRLLLARSCRSFTRSLEAAIPRQNIETFDLGGLTHEHL
jgi:hypothetical protein